MWWCDGRGDEMNWDDDDDGCGGDNDTLNHSHSRSDHQTDNKMRCMIHDISYIACLLMLSYVQYIIWWGCISHVQNHHYSTHQRSFAFCICLHQSPTICTEPSTSVWVIFVDEQQRCHTEPLEKSVAAAGVYFPTKLGSLDSFGGQI